MSKERLQQIPYLFRLGIWLALLVSGVLSTHAADAGNPSLYQ